ncbi:MAG: hypothetical protein PVS3B3_31880 [Ktedonobacteraceae bacterium]
MSEQHREEDRRITKEQVIAVGGTLLTSGIIDVATHGNLPVMLGGAVAVFAAGKLTPEIMKLLLPGSDPDATSVATNAVVNRLAPPPEDDNRPQDALSKMKRLIGMKSAEAPARPKDEPASDLPRQQSPEAPGAKDKPAPAPVVIPPQFNLEHVLESIIAANEGWHIYFGQNGAGEAITVSIDDMYHVLDVSSSGKGKSNRFRLAMMQLVGTCEVYYINPFAARVKSVKDSRRVEVWAPILDRLANGKPMKSKEEINQITTALIDLIQDRSDREEAGDFSWQEEPVFIFVDELPETFARCPEAVERLDKIGRTGRQFGVFLWVASQTSLVKEIGQSTAAQANYKTRIYGGGDSTSATRLMKRPVSSENEQALQTNGAGLTLMLADGMNGLELVRAPLVTNEALFEYFGLTFTLDDWLPSRGTMSPRRGHALNLSASTEKASMPSNQRPVQPQEHHHDTATQYDTITRLYESGKIDMDTFVRLLDHLDITDADVSRPVPSPETEGHKISSETPNLRLVQPDNGTVPAATEYARNEHGKPIPTMPELSPMLGKDDYEFSFEQAQDFLRRYRKTPDIHACLAQMVNSKGEIGISKRYYKHAAWLVSQQQQREGMKQ